METVGIESSSDLANKLHKVWSGQDSGVFGELIAEAEEQNDIKMKAAFEAFARVHCEEYNRMVFTKRTPTPESIRLRAKSVTARRKLLEDLAKPDWANLNTELVESREPEIFDKDVLRQHMELINKEEFQDWIFINKSAKLLIQGSQNEHPIVGIPSEYEIGRHWPPEVTSQNPLPLRFLSGMSELSRIIRQTLEKNAGVVCLNFYCGMHLTVSPLARGGQGMIRSLIAQLVADRAELREDPNDEQSPAKEYFNMNSLDQNLLRNVLPNANAASLKDLCDLFVKLVRQLQLKSALVCIIDGINHYEGDRNSEEYFKVISILEGLVEEENDDLCVLKLLLLSPQHLNVEWLKFDADNCLTFDSENDGWLNAEDSPDPTF